MVSVHYERTPDDQLSEREHEIVIYLAHGVRQHQIGEKMGIHHETVKSHTYRARTRWNATSNTHLVAMAVRRGYLDGYWPDELAATGETATDETAVGDSVPSS